MEVATITIAKEVLQRLVTSEALKTSEFKVKLVKDDSHDYTKDPIWIAQQKKSRKEYAKLKEIEFKLRHP